MEVENEILAESGIDDQELEEKTKISEKIKIDSTTNGAPSGVETKQNSSHDIEDVIVEQEVVKKPKKNRNKSYKNEGIQKNTCQNGAVDSDAVEKVTTGKPDNNEEKVEKPQKKEDSPAKKTSKFWSCENR